MVKIHFKHLVVIFQFNSFTFLSSFYFKKYSESAFYLFLNNYILQNIANIFQSNFFGKYNTVFTDFIFRPTKSNIVLNTI